MDRKQILEHLALADRQILDGENVLSRQRVLMEKMVLARQNTTAVSATYEECQRAQRIHIDHRGRLRRLLPA